MSRLRWPDSTNSVSDVPGTIHVASCGQAKMKLFDYIEVFYNLRRRQSTPRSAWPSSNAVKLRRQLR